MIYARLYPKVTKAIRDRVNERLIHGAEVRDLFLILYPGIAIDNHAEQILTELVEAGEIKPHHRAPTQSQAAFIGLQFSSKAYNEMKWEPGIKEHYYYFAG